MPHYAWVESLLLGDSVVYIPPGFCCLGVRAPAPWPPSRSESLTAPDLSSLLLTDRAIAAGHQESARGYYDEALRSDDRGIRAQADLCLGYLLTWQGDDSGANRFFRAAVAEDAPPASTEASEQLQGHVSREAAQQLLVDPPKRRLVFGLGRSGEDLDRP